MALGRCEKLPGPLTSGPGDGRRSDSADALRTGLPSLLLERARRWIGRSTAVLSRVGGDGPMPESSAERLLPVDGSVEADRTMTPEPCGGTSDSLGDGSTGDGSDDAELASVESLRRRKGEGGKKRGGQGEEGVGRTRGGGREKKKTGPAGVAVSGAWAWAALQRRRSRTRHWRCRGTSS